LFAISLYLSRSTLDDIWSDPFLVGCSSVITGFNPRLLFDLEDCLRDCYDQNYRYDEIIKASFSKMYGGNGSPRKGGKSVAGVIDTFTDNHFNCLGLPIKLARSSIKELIKRGHHVIDFIADHSHH
jgi:hypothetical protein